MRLHNLVSEIPSLQKGNKHHRSIFVNKNNITGVYFEKLFKII